MGIAQSPTLSLFLFEMHFIEAVSHLWESFGLLKWKTHATRFLAYSLNSFLFLWKLERGVYFNKIFFSVAFKPEKPFWDLDVSITKGTRQVVIMPVGDFAVFN